MKARPWTKEEDRIALDMWSDGVSATDIGEELGRSRGSILSRIHRISPDTKGHVLGPVVYADGKRRDVHALEPELSIKMRNWRRATEGARKARMQHGNA